MSRFSPRTSNKRALPNAFTTYATRSSFLSDSCRKEKSSHQRMQSDRLYNRHPALPCPALLCSLLQPSHPRTEPQGGLIARSWQAVGIRTKRVKKRERERKGYRWKEGRKENATYLGLIRCIRYSLSRGLHLPRCTLVNAAVCGRNLSRHIRGHVKHAIWDPHPGKGNV